MPDARTAYALRFGEAHLAQSLDNLRILSASLATEVEAAMGSSGSLFERARRAAEAMKRITGQVTGDADDEKTRKIRQELARFMQPPTFDADKARPVLEGLTIPFKDLSTIEGLGSAIFYNFATDAFTRFPRNSSYSAEIMRALDRTANEVLADPEILRQIVTTSESQDSAANYVHALLDTVVQLLSSDAAKEFFTSVMYAGRKHRGTLAMLNPILSVPSTEAERQLDEAVATVVPSRSPSRRGGATEHPPSVAVKAPTTLRWREADLMAALNENHPGWTDAQRKFLAGRLLEYHRHSSRTSVPDALAQLKDIEMYDRALTTVNDMIKKAEGKKPQAVRR